jgi:mxaJ protein
MSSACESFRSRVKTAAAIVMLLGAWASLLVLVKGSPARAAPAPAQRTLRVCADPNSLPFYNERGEGFENQLAELVARRLGLKVSYTFWPQRRGFVKNTLGKQLCDVVIGVPARYERTENTLPYYRSSYVFVTRSGSGPAPQSLDDPALRTLRIGVHVVGDDYNNPPPAESLARRGIVDNVHGYSIYGDYSKPSPTRSLVDALEKNEIDVAIAWGPLVGDSVKRSGGRLTLNPVTPQVDGPGLVMAFDIAMGVRRGDHELRAKLDKVLREQQAQARELLSKFGVPLDPFPPKEPK